MLKASLQLRLGQSLTLTPQLQQTIRLLQYSTLELQQQIQQMIEQNPLLEMEESAPQATETQEAEQVPAREDQELQGPGASENQSIPDELPLDTSWDAIYDSLPSTSVSNTTDSDPGAYLENQSGNGADLREHLLLELLLTPLSHTDEIIGQTIILNINDDGYLSDSLDNIHATLQESLDEEISLDEVRAIQHLIMQLDPVGCGSENLRDSLIAQLRQHPETDLGKQHARRLLEQFFPELEKQNLKLLTGKSGLPPAKIEQAMELIRSLNPRPGATVGGDQPHYVAPDTYVTQQGDRWQVSLNPDISPSLKIHPFYSSLIKRGDKSEDNRYIRDQLQEARWFIKSIRSRNETILRVAQVIVEKQQDFFEQGEEAMHPMVLRDVAETLGMHESTISRVTNQKYMLTPRGLLEFKYFFSSQLNTSDGGNASATAIRAMIRKLVGEENPQKPLSDSKITSILLEEKGIKVARRTIAKYREAMRIPPSNERKRIA